MLPNTRVFQMKRLSNQNVCFPRTRHYFALLCCFPFYWSVSRIAFSLLRSLVVSQFMGCILWRTHLKDNYVTMPCEGCPNPKAPPNATQKQGLLCSLFGWCYPSRPPISQDSLRARKKKNKRKHQVTQPWNVPKATPSHLTMADAVNKVSLKEREATKAGSFEGCRPWIGTQHLSRLFTLDIETGVLQLLFNNAANWGPSTRLFLKLETLMCYSSCSDVHQDLPLLFLFLLRPVCVVLWRE